MIKKTIASSIKTLLSNPKLIRIAFLTTFWHTVYRLYLIIYFLNTLLISRYESWVQFSDAIFYIFNKIQEFDIIGLIIGFIIVIVIGNFLIYPIGEASIVYYIQNQGKKMASAITKGIKKFFLMFEYNGLWFAFWLYTITTITLRLLMMGILDNIILKIIIIFWFIIVLFATFFRPYTKYYILIKDLKVFDAIKKSMYLTMQNPGLTIKGVLFEMLLFVRFIINALIVVGIPTALIYLAVFFNIIDNARVEQIIWIVAGLMLLLVAYINAILESFFNLYRYKIFEKAQENE